MSPTDNYRTLYPNTKELMGVSEAHTTFSQIDHIFGNKACLSNQNNVKTALCIRSDHYGLKFGINKNRNNRNYTNSEKQTVHYKTKNWVKTDNKKNI